MKFGWINAFGAAFVILLLIPNVVYALRNKGEENRCRNVVMNAAEQLGRYACIVLMWLPWPVREFGFASVFAMILYLAGGILLLAAYWILYLLYMKRRSRSCALVLAILPACLFLVCGLLLRHWLLVGFAVLFAAAHVYVTMQNAEKNDQAG